MSASVPPPSDPRDERLARLLAEQGWLRRLAGALLRDPAGADDLAQDAWVAALQRPPATAASPRGWLATVLRRRLSRVRRAAARRRRREQAAARPEPLPDTAALAATADLQRRVLEEVLALAAPMRDALLLRYQEGLEPAAIAARLGAPLETVRTRLRRGLAALRVRLGAGFEGGPGGLRRALHGFLRSGPLGASAGTALGVGGVLMATKTWMLAAAALALGVTGWALLSDRAPGGPTPTRAPAHGPSASGPAGPRLEAPAGGPGVADASRAETAPPTRSGVTLVGFVRRPDGAPAAGARVAVEREDGSGAQAEVGADGRFVLEAGGPAGALGERLLVVARQDALAGLAEAWLAPASAAARPLSIVLASAHPIRVRVTHAGGPVPAARVALATLPDVLAFPLLERTGDAAGRVDLGLWPRGTYRVTATGPGLGRGQALCVLPYEAGEISVEVGEGRDLAVRVLEQGTEQAVAGAEVLVLEDLQPLTGVGALAPYRPAARAAPTAAAGRTRLLGLDPRAALVVVALAPGAQPPNPDWVGGDAFRVGGWPGEGEHVVRVVRRSLRSWRVEPGELPVPPDGTPVDVRSTSGSLLAAGAWTAAGEVRGGLLTADCYFREGIYAEARTPDGALARLLWQPNREQGQPTSFRRPRSVDVRVRTGEGAPAAGVRVQVGGLDEGPGAARATDADGLARFTGFWGRRHRVYALRPGQPSGDVPGDPVAEVDLEAGSASIEVTIGTERDVLVLGEIDGRPGLPADPVFFSWGPLEPVESDPAAGRARLRVRSQRGQPSAHLRIGGAGVVPVSLEIPLEGDLRPFEARVRFVRRVELGARIVLPSDGVAEPRLERFDEGRGQWVVEWMPGFLRSGPASTFLLSTAAPGRHRLVDGASGALGPEVAVEALEPAPLLTLDLGGVRVLEGRVLGPAGADLRLSQVLPEGAAPAPPGPPPPPGAVVVAPAGPAGPLPVDADGRFRLRLPPGATRTLVVRHPELEPDPRRGRVQAPGAGPLELVLVEGASAALVFEPAAVRVPDRPATVQLFEPGSAGSARRACGLTLGATGARFGGFEPGTYDLWFDVPPFAPRRLTGVVLGPGRTDLGAVALSPGARVRLRVEPAPGQPPPRIHVAAYAESPRHWRAVGPVEALDPVELAGLGPGAYRLLVTLARSGERVLDEPLVVEGEELLERTVRLGAR